MAVTANENQFLFVEKYRPDTLSECILPPRIKSLAEQLVESGEATNLLFSGSGGVGKTTTAIAIAKQNYFRHVNLPSFGFQQQILGFR